MAEKKKYEYEGVVKSYGNIVSQNWKSTTYAVTKERAMSNIQYNYNKSHKIKEFVDAKIDVNKLKEVR